MLQSTETIQNDTENPQIGLLRTEKPILKSFSTDFMLSPNSSYPSKMSIDLIERKYPKNPERDVISINVAITGHIAATEVDTPTQYLNGTVGKNGKISFAGKPPKSLGKDAGKDGNSTVFQHENTKFVIPEEKVEEFFEQIIRDHAYISKSELNEFIRYDELTRVIRDEIREDICKTFGPDGPEYDQVLSSNAYISHINDMFQISSGRMERSGGGFISILGEQFFYGESEITEWKSDLNNLYTFIQSELDNEFEKISEYRPTNPGLMELMFGEVGQEIIERTFKDEKINEVVLEGGEIDYREMLGYLAKDYGEIIFEHGFTPPNNPTVTFFKTPFLYTPEDETYGSTWDQCLMTASNDCDKARRYIIDQIVARIRENHRSQKI